MYETGSKEKKNINEYNILITGGTGLVGNELITQLLQSGKKVKAIYHNTPLTLFENNPNVSISKCDILDSYLLGKLMLNVDQVYHCAAMVSFNPSQREELLRTNIEGTTNVVNACLEAGIDKLVYVSSVAAMGRIRENEMVSETMFWSEKTSNSIYGKSKYLAEMEVWRGIGEGLHAVIVNPTIILGGNNWEKGSSAIFKSAFEEFPWYTEGISGFVSVKDVVKAMIMLMNSEIENERFILNAINTSYKYIFCLIAKEFNKKCPYKKVTPLMSAIIWRWEAAKSYFTGNKPLLTKETAHTAFSKVYFDNRKIKDYLPGFDFEPVEKIIGETCDKLKLKYNL